MSRFLAALSAFVVFVSLAPAAEPASGLRIRWHGQSFFEIITPKGTRIVFDPHGLEAYGKKTVKADLVLMSHLHTDHTRVEGVVELSKGGKAINALKRDPESRVEDWNMVDEKFKDVRYQNVATYHDESSGLQRGKNGVWILDVEGIRIVHLGDLGHQLIPAAVRKLGTVDVLMIPVGGVYTLNGLTAMKVVDQIKPRQWILPMHYGTAVYDDLLPLKYFTDEKPEDMKMKVFKKDEWLVIDPKAAPPEKPTLGVLHF
jgi:L-ascorbate metabolism protein UlaG (beta-lactamase superfamily)